MRPRHPCKPRGLNARRLSGPGTQRGCAHEEPHALLQEGPGRRFSELVPAQQHCGFLGAQRATKARGGGGGGGGALTQTHGRGPAAWVPNPPGDADTCSSLRTTGTVTTNCRPHWKHYPTSRVLWDEVSSHLVFQKARSGSNPNRTGQQSQHVRASVTRHRGGGQGVPALLRPREDRTRQRRGRKTASQAVTWEEGPRQRDFACKTLQSSKTLSRQCECPEELDDDRVTHSCCRHGTGTTRSHSSVQTPVTPVEKCLTPQIQRGRQ